jgi:hypothetical protein
VLWPRQKPSLDRTIVAVRCSNDLNDLILFEREVGKKNSVGSERMTKGTDKIRLQCAGQVMPYLVDEPWQPNAASERVGWGAQFHFAERLSCADRRGAGERGDGMGGSIGIKSEDTSRDMGRLGVGFAA